MPNRQSSRVVGVTLLAVPLVLQIPYGFLSLTFSYPAILREDAATILARFAEGGPGLIAAWYLYALAIVPMMFVIPLLPEVLAPKRSRWMGLAVWFGMGSVVVQVVALLRWTFLVPLLAGAWAKPGGGAERASLEAIFTAQHQLLGTMLGEHVGQFLLAVWTLLMAQAQVEHPFQRWLGRVAAGAFLLGLGSHLGAVFPLLRGLEPVPGIAFLLWSVWVVVLGVQILREGAVRTGRHGGMLAA